jgi:hypothetical protein
VQVQYEVYEPKLEPIDFMNREKSLIPGPDGMQDLVCKICVKEVTKKVYCECVKPIEKDLYWDVV